MPETLSPREVFLRVLDGVAARDVETLAGFYAEPTDVLHPFDPQRAPALRSPAELRKHFEGGFALTPHIDRHAVNVVIHETTDPEVVIGEFDYRTTNTTTGETVDLPHIFVWRVRDGKIVESRDYVDHHASYAAMGLSPAG